MEGFDPASSFGPEVAARYDECPRGDEAETVDFLAEWAGDGSALELAIGTGRIALPLIERGVHVDGIELSSADMSRVAAGGSYRLVYLVFNTIYNLLTQDDQVRCFENAARHPAPNGVFVV